MQAINFEQNCAPHWGRAQGKDKKHSAVRPVKFSVRSFDVTNQILRKAKLLRTKEGFKSV
jgi:hypothetical protein